LVPSDPSSATSTTSALPAPADRIRALTLTGTLVSAAVGSARHERADLTDVALRSDADQVNRTIALAVPETALLQSLGPTGTSRAVSSLTLAQKGDKVVVWTLPAPATLKAERGDDDVLNAALIQLTQLG
jgi:hypothetical protein